MKRNLMAGLSILIPFVATIWILRILFRRFTTPFVYWMKKTLVYFHFHPDMIALTLLAHITIFFLLIAFTCLLGYASSLGVVQGWVHRWHRFVLRIPLLSLVYEPTHRLLQLILDPNKKVFEMPKAMHFDDIRAYAVGLRTISEPLAHIESHLGAGVEVILLPGVPNPLIGFVLFVKKRAHKNLDLTVEETVKFIVSCGLLHPTKRRL